MKILKNFSFLKQKIRNQPARSKKIIINASNSFIIKMFSMLASFLLLSMSVKCINAENFGVWITISSLIGWIYLLDVGLLTSLKNKITETLAFKDWKTAQKYISTAYALLAVVIVPSWLAFFFIYTKINWQAIFNTSIPQETLESIMLAVFTSFSLQFFLKPISSILQADQKHFLENLISLITNLATIIILFVFQSYFINSLYLISLLFAFLPCIIVVLFTITLFFTKYKILKPSINSIDFKYRKELLGLGFKFFIIQITGVLMFTANNFIISHFLGNDEVTQYNIAIKYFSIIIMVYSIINVPFWTAFTDAYTLQDWQWIKKVTKQANFICTIFVGAVLLMLLFSSWVYEIWIGPSVNISIALSALIALKTCIKLFSSVYTSFINGTGKIRLQTYLCIFVSILHIPLGYFIIKVIGLGLNGVVVLSIFWATISLILWSTQFNKIMNRSKAYIWN